MAEGTQRIDKWLWYARFFKTRSLASALVQAGKIRLTPDGQETERVDKPSRTVKPGDTLTFVQGTRVKVIKVLAPGTRRGPAPEAQALYEDLSPPEQKPEETPETPSTPAAREKGAGRPTKRDRRAIDRFRSDTE